MRSKRGGNRPGAGRTQVNFRVDLDTARRIRIVCAARSISAETWIANHAAEDWQELDEEYNAASEAATESRQLAPHAADAAEEE